MYFYLVYAEIFTLFLVSGILGSDAVWPGYLHF